MKTQLNKGGYSLKIHCEGCGSWHTASPTAMAVIISAFQRGDLQQVTGKGVEVLCMGDALTPETVAAQAKQGKKTVISFDRTRYETEEAA